MKITRWQRAVSLLLCLLMAMSFFVVTAPKAYADESAEVTWPQLTSFTMTANYVFNNSRPKKQKAACKVVTSTAEIENYNTIREKTINGKAYSFVGVIKITVKAPVKVEYDPVTGKTSIKDAPVDVYPTNLIIKGYDTESLRPSSVAEDVKIDVSTAINVTKDSEDDSFYQSSLSSNIGNNLELTMNNQFYYYDCIVTIESSTSENKVPTIKAGLSNSLAATVGGNQAWTIDLSQIFEDAEDDELTYTVSVNDGDAQPVNGSTYSYTLSGEATSATLVFKASDGKLESEAYTVTLTKEVIAYHAITTSTEGTYQWNSATGSMGNVISIVEGGQLNQVRVGSTVTIKAEPTKYVVTAGAVYDAQFSAWKVTGITLNDAQRSSDTLTFEMPDNDVTITAVFVKKGSLVKLKAQPVKDGELRLYINATPNSINSTYSSDSKTHVKDVVEDVVIADAHVSAQLIGKYNPASRLSNWVIKNETSGVELSASDIAYDTKTYPGQPDGGESYQVPTFKVDGKSEYSITAIFEAKDYGAVNVTVNNAEAKMGKATAQIDGGNASSKLPVVYEGITVKLKATPKEGFIFKSWKASYGDDTSVTITDENAAETTFTMPATTGRPVNVVATFVEDPNYLSEKCVLESVSLLDHSGNTFEGDQDGTAFTVTLPADADASNLANMVLKLTYSKNAKVFRDGDTTAWDVNGQACNMTLGTAAKFVVRSQKDLAEGNEGPTREYTITIQKAASPDTPTLSNGSATRTSKTGATVKFTSSEAGNYFYKVVDHGATAPTADEIMKSTTKGTASTGEITFTLSNLTEDARDIYIVVVSAAGGESAPLKVEIPAYGSGTDTPDTGAYKISISAPKGGTITTNRTKADKGDEIIVTVTPDNGYQMVSGSLTYTLAKEGGETKTITNNRFTMPAGDVSITCKWETATTTAKGITSFSINGVAGAVNNSTNTITITMPRGTDVTKLTPVIATNGVKSLTPGNGETVDFTNAVTYTAAMEDGSSKTYTVTVYVDKGTLADQFWDKLTDFANQVPWWQYAEKQQSTSKYPKYW